MDTTVMEYTADGLIAHKLQRAGILVAKPKFNQEGADLLAFLDVSDGAKFCRVRCKGRSLVRSSSSSIEIPTHYVTDGLIMFLFVETGASDNTHLYCFFGPEIRAWGVRNGSYFLSISRSAIASTLTAFAFDDCKIKEIKKAIINVDLRGEFKKVIHGYLDATEEGGDTFGATGTVSSSSE